MEILIKYIIPILFIAAFIIGVNYINKIQLKKLEKLEKIRKRIHEVAEYRDYLLNKLSIDDFLKLPSYDEMLESHKPLEDKYWIANLITEKKSLLKGEIKKLKMKF